MLFVHALRMAHRYSSFKFRTQSTIQKFTYSSISIICTYTATQSLREKSKLIAEIQLTNLLAEYKHN